MTFFKLSRRTLAAFCAAAMLVPMAAQAAVAEFTDLAGRRVVVEKTPERFIVANIHRELFDDGRSEEP